MAKDEAETALVDYFVVCGYDQAVGLSFDNGCGTSPECAPEGFSRSERLRPPMQRSFMAKILNHFPQKRRDAPFSQEIIALSMPKGLRFYTEKDVPSRPVVHTFVNVKEDGSKVYGSALTFFEEVRDPYLCEEMVKLHMEHVRELTTRDRMSERTHVAPGTVSGGTHTLPRGHRADRMKRISYYDGGMHKQLYMTKTLCLITRLPMVNVTGSILRSLKDMLSSPDAETAPLPLESYIYWILNEIPLPTLGTTLKVSLHTTPLVLQRPGIGELPFFDYSLSNLFDLMHPEKFMRLLTCFFLEHQILICSKELGRLMLVCESLCSLAFPFQWSLAYAPILPYSQLKFIEAPVPYVMGMCYEDEVPEYLFQSNVCVFDVDTGRVEFPEDMPPFPQQKEICNDIRTVLKRFAALEEPENISKSVVYNNGEDTFSPTMRHSNLRKREDWSLKRMSRSFDGDALEALNGIMGGGGGGGNVPNRSQLQPLPLENVLKNNSTMSRVAEIARRAGVDVDVTALEQELTGNDNLMNSSVSREYFKEAKLNNAVREIILNRVTGMLYSYEHFVVGTSNCPDLETFESTRDSVVCFDKASFLSDQPDSHLAFLAAFLETQMFTDFIDDKIKAQWQPPEDNLRLFDARIKEMQQKLGLSMVRTPTYETTPPFAHTEELITKREECVDYVVPSPHLLSGAPPMRYDGTWPELNTAVLEGSSSLSPAPSPWKQRYNRRKPLESPTGVNSGLPLRPTSIYGGAGLLGETPSQVAQQQLKFVEQLLKETKGKTKRMLVNKMGKEAVHLGHVDASVTGVEENTLVASFCDLLERIWSHGLIKKQGKSALWTYVLQHQDLEKAVHSNHSHLSTSMLTPASAAVSTTAPSPNGIPLVDPRHRPSRPPRPPVRQAVPYPGSRPRALSGAPGARDQSLPPVSARADAQEQPQEASSTLSDLVDSIQKELASKDDPDAPAWSKNFLKAANFLCDKIQEASRRPREPSKEREPGMLTSMLLGSSSRSSSVTRGGGGGPMGPPMGPRRLKKCSSVSDFTTPGFGASGHGSRDGSASVEGSPRKRSVSRPRSPDGRVVLPSLPTHIAYDLKNVLRMAEIKTDIGYARAFVRLALERKLLHKHLATLLNCAQLTGDLYKPYAFCRCEDEREQFLYHILSLNAAQYRCFTNTFTKTKMDYQVVVVTGSWRGALPAVWMSIEGSHGNTPTISLPEGTPLFKFDHRNLGVLSTLRIGHASREERPPKWYLDYIIVRNEITGQMYRFPCGRWFGKGVDDGSLERLLVAEPIQDYNPDQSEMVPPGSPARGRRKGGASSRSQTPQRERSPSLVRESSGVSGGGSKKHRMQEIEQHLGEAVNRLVKYFYSERQPRSELVHLLCGERGLVPGIEAAFQFGRQDSIWTSRLFRQNYPWDYVEKVSAWFWEFLRRGEGEKLSRGQRELVTYGLKLVKRIGEKPGLGKDGKFHVFILITIRDHVLSGFLQLMSWTPVTSQLYDDPSFLRTPTLLSHMSKLLESLNEFQFHIEKSLTYGIV